MFVHKYLKRSVAIPSLDIRLGNGKAVFLKYKCDNCHSVNAAGITPKLKTKAPDLIHIIMRHEKDGEKDFVHK